MSVTEKDVRYVANLAKLSVDDDEVKFYADNLSRIVALVEQMNDAQTDNVEPLSHPQDAPLRLREDRVTEADQRDDFQKVAPAASDGLYLVPKVIE